MEGTPEQNFIIMLKERMDYLEDQLLKLENTILQLKSTRYHHIKVKTNTKTIPEVLNYIFLNRIKINPAFSAWYWSKQNDTLHINLILSTHEEIREDIMKEYLNDPMISYNPISDLYTFIQYFQTYFHDEDEADEVYPYEYWHCRYGCLFDKSQSEMTDEPFISSVNYSPCKELQQKLRQWIFDKCNWIDILRIFY